MRRFVRALAAVALTAATGGVVAAASPASAATTCTAPSVRIVVDFRHWAASSTNGSAGNIVTGCGTWSASMTGYSLLNGTGFSTEGTRHDGPGFVCRINVLPSEQDDACVATPPATAYWSYWHADPGDTTWTYSTLGAMSYHPKPGSVDLWQFGATNVEGTQGLPTLNPRDYLPTAASSAPPAGGTAPSSGGGSNGSGSGGGPGTNGTTTGGGAGSSASTGTSSGGTAATRGTPSAGSTTPAKPGAPSSAAASGSDRASDAPPSSVDIDSIAKPAGSTTTGTPWATLATVGALAVAALIGGGVAWRRKRSSP